MERVSECLSVAANDSVPSSPSPHSAAHKHETDPKSACSAETHILSCHFSNHVKWQA